MKVGGQIIYHGPLGQKSIELVKYFEVDCCWTSTPTEIAYAVHGKSRFLRPSADSVMPQAIPGVPRLREGLNPATWMLQISTPGMEKMIGVDFAVVYKGSATCRRGPCTAHGHVTGNRNPGGI